MPRGRFDDKAALVTGAGSGIGRATAVLLAARGARLFLCDVNETGLRETEALVEKSGTAPRVRVVDVARRDAMQAYAEEVHREVAAVDVLVNNAGVGLGGGFLDTSLEDWEWVLSINLWGVIHGCHYFLPAMVARRQGHVVNVASAAGLLATAELAAYGTSKYAVVGLSEALRDELAPHGIHVSTICPGLINTPITKTARLRGERTPPREQLVALYERRNYGPERVAAAIVDAIDRRRGLVPVTPEAWLIHTMKRLLPDTAPRIFRRLGERMQKRK